ncbi:UNVERIFIED_CONTAM: hypothetical protein Cloal_1729 [Acetivibrio alkalicellulosi]
MFRKKFLSIIVVLCILSTLFFGVNVLANYRENNSRNNFFNNQEKSLEIHEKILTEYKEDNLDYFGGFFLDDEGVLNINLVEDNKQKAENNKQRNAKELVKGDNVKFHYVKHSLNTLNNTANVLANEMLSLGINAVEVDEINNAVIVYLDSLSKEVEIKNKIDSLSKEVEIKNKIDVSTVIFKETDSRLTIQKTYNVNVINGEEMTFPIGGNQHFAYTIGFGARCNSTGNYGFLITGHGAYSSGDQIFYNGDHFATVRRKHFGGAVDAGFAERVTNTWFWQPTYRPTNSLQGTDVCNTYAFSYSYPINTVIYCYGAVSRRRGGVILSNNYSFIADGVSMNNMVKSDYVAVIGDSGAPVVTRHLQDGIPAHNLIGLQSSSKRVLQCLHLKLTERGNGFFFRKLTLHFLLHITTY